ncbi:MAG TPA: S53 family peptidase [Kofleriaceae bacterium]|nr:S53 family peptidase [Kofleriaceae bacterium]
MRIKYGLLGVAALPALACTASPEPDAVFQSAQQVGIANNTPGFIRHAQDLGPVDPSTVIEVTAWLKLHNEGQLDQLVAQQQQRGHANFQRWITQDQFNAQFAPTAQEVNAVQNWLNAHKLTTVAVAENNFFVKVQGTVGDVEKAFHVQIDRFDLDGQILRANVSNPSINDPSGNHVAAITGLDDLGFAPQHVRPIGPDGVAPRPVPLSQVSPDGGFFEGACFRGVETHTFTGGGTTATYTGNRYGADITNTTVGHLAPCGYSPAEVRAAYNMNPLYAAGLDGAGQTIVITDAFGSPTIERDAAVFSQVFGLPPVDLTVVKAPGLVHNPGEVDWAGEVTLDVEWAHAMAPGARIALVVATARSSLDEAINYAVVHHLGNTISNSWSTLEGFGNPAQLGRVERILQMAAAQGIDVNFSSGDNGDEAARAGFITVDYPASSPFATSIGGTSLALDAQRNLVFETGWGTNETRVAATAAEGNAPQNPPLDLGFVFGAGGGTSLTFAKPGFQAGMPGARRLVPDIGMLADPFTGTEIIQTDTATGELTVGVIGGTSLACPLFSGLMAIASQKAGTGLGQAAPLLYGLSSGIRDITGAGANNVTGQITTASGTTALSAEDLAHPATSTPFISALYNSPFSTRWFVLSFNTDTSLAAAPGWDNVTGVGAPDGAAFVAAIAP